MKELYNKIKAALLELVDPFDQSLQMFRSVKVDTGQFERIINNVENSELPYNFPAVFIHFVNVYYLVSQQNISEGKGTMRVRFILNRLNNDEDEFETEIFDYAGYVNAAIQDAKQKYGIEKCNLEYFDMPTAPSRGLQACWLDYTVSFIDDSGDKYRDWLDKTITTPMFTNRSDVAGETRPDIGSGGYEDQIKINDTLPV